MQLESLLAENKRLRRKKEERDAEVEKLAAEVAALTARAEAQGEEVRSQVAAALVEASDARAQARQLERELATAQAEHDRLVAALEDALEAAADTPVTTDAATVPSPHPPSVDIGRLLRDQKESLRAEHEAALKVRRATAVDSNHSMKHSLSWGVQIQCCYLLLELIPALVTLAGGQSCP